MNEKKIEIYIKEWNQGHAFPTLKKVNGVVIKMKQRAYGSLMHMATHKSVPLHSVNGDAQSDDKLYRYFHCQWAF